MRKHRRKSTLRIDANALLLIAKYRNEEAKSDGEIAALTGLSKEKVRKILQAAGCAPLSKRQCGARGNQRLDPLPEPVRQRLIAAHRDHLVPIVALVERFALRKARILQILKEAGAHRPGLTKEWAA